MKSLWNQLNSLLTKLAHATRDFFLLAVRLYWGWQFFLSGKGKLGNLDGTTEFFAGLGLPAPHLQAILAGGTECVGGLLLLIGLGSRVISVPLMFTMLVAYGTAHLASVKTIWSDPDNFVTQAPFLFLMASAIVFFFGPGWISLDHWLGRKEGA